MRVISITVNNNITKINENDYSYNKYK